MRFYLFTLLFSILFTSCEKEKTYRAQAPEYMFKHYPFAEQVQDKYEGIFRSEENPSNFFEFSITNYSYESLGLCNNDTPVNKCPYTLGSSIQSSIDSFSVNYIPEYFYTTSYFQSNLNDLENGRMVLSSLAGSVIVGNYSEFSNIESELHEQYKLEISKYHSSELGVDVHTLKIIALQEDLFLQELIYDQYYGVTEVSILTKEDAFEQSNIETYKLEK